MVASLRFFIEGGGEIGQPGVKYLAQEMREAFHGFFVRAGVPNRRLHIVRCGSRLEAYHRFCADKQYDRSGEIKILLVDSEDPVAASYSGKPWDFLQKRDGWQPPGEATDEQAHLMVQCMESWFLADLGKLKHYFGQGFDDKKLPKTHPIETASKQAVLHGLDQAAKNTTKKGYRKGAHAFAILKLLDPIKVQQQSPWTCRLFKTLDVLLDNTTNSTRECQEQVREA
ncbi:MAG: DUF4276 family protein [Magnetococcales bacterium]|nr:DUF4276 family protein [Magnetococcales bacterium]MBF0116703.1 DUF4276 family protein [Magnetococcales bacterium]